MGPIAFGKAGTARGARGMSEGCPRDATWTSEGHRDGAMGTRAGGGLWARVGLVWRVAWPYLMSKGCPEFLHGVKMIGLHYSLLANDQFGV